MVRRSEGLIPTNRQRSRKMSRLRQHFIASVACLSLILVFHLKNWPGELDEAMNELFGTHGLAAETYEQWLRGGGISGHKSMAA